MRERMKRLGICLLALLCLCPAGRAEFSPAWSALTEAGGAEITVTGRVTASPNLKKAALEALNELLSGLSVTAAVNAENALIRMDKGEENVLTVTVQRRKDDVLTSFGPAGGAYMTAPGERDALALLTDRSGDWPPDAGLLQHCPALASAVFSALGRHAEPRVNGNRKEMRNTGGAASTEIYAFAKDELTDEIWEEAVDALLPPLREALARQKELCGQIETVLRDTHPVGEWRAERFLNRDGGDMGFQLFGTVIYREEQRKVKIYLGYEAGRGGYATLALPAVRGEDTLKASLEWKETERGETRTLSISGSATRRRGGETVGGEMDISLKNSMSADGESWTGKITVSRTENKLKTVWTLKPQLETGAEGIGGTVQIQYQEGKRDPVKAEATLTVGPGTAIAAPTPAAARDLREMPQAEARAAVQAEWAPLTGAAAWLMATLSEEQRTHLTHEWRTDAWMNGPDVPPVAETDGAPAKEDTQE